MKNNKVKHLVLLGLFTAILLVMSWTPLGYLKVGFLEITLNVIPLAVAAITLGPVGGAVTGAVFGLTSFLQCIGIGGLSPLGEVLFGISPVYCFIVCFLPRLLDGYLSGLIFRGLSARMPKTLACYITGFGTAFLNTAFFMTALIALYGNSAYMQELIAGRNIFEFVCVFVGINAVFEMIACTVVSGAVGSALYRAGVVSLDNK